PGWPRPFPPPGRAVPAAAAGRSLPAPAHAPRRARPGGLGKLRQAANRRRLAPAAGLCHGLELVAPDLPALLPQRPHGELPATPPGGLPRLAGLSASPALRQPQERGARAARRGRALASDAARARR